MNFKKSALASAITLATFATTAAAFDASGWEVSGFVKNETAALQGSGTFIGQESTSVDTTSHNDSGDVIKFENTAKVFINGDVAENAALHAELNFVYDTEATPNDYQGHMNYSQNDYLRELYVDTMVGETEVRVGKQQVVWGTADGIKLLDIINPTDYREFAQNTMEDSRVPVWMLKTDTFVGDSGSLQFVLSQARGNKIVGLGSASGSGSSHSNGDQGNPYIMKGVDTITGKVHGFLNIAPQMGAVADAFGRQGNSIGMSQASVDDFVTNAHALNTGQAYNFRGICDGTNTYAACLDAVVNDDLLLNQGFGTVGARNANQQNLFENNSGAGDNAAWTAEKNNPTQMFSYMPDATFATFVSFEGMSSEYRVERPDDFDLNTGLRFKDSLDNGLNYSVNYFYHYDSNPYVETHWENSSGSKVSEEASGAGTDSGTYVTSGKYITNTVNSASGNLNLVFTEKYQRIHSIGGAFDYTVETEALPIVLRGEFLYDKDTMTPVITRHSPDGVDLNHGFFTSSLKNEKADFFKYVIGADINVLTNMMVSGQFIQFRNLDYVDVGDSSSATWKYTGDQAAMHLTNGLKKAKENKEFYSLFLSKPFGANQLGRWNNIFMYEEDGGKWNRFDVEYSFSDELIGSFELNNYWGDENTQFGQMEDSSNIQVGLKYLF